MLSIPLLPTPYLYVTIWCTPMGAIICVCVCVCVCRGLETVVIREQDVPLPLTLYCRKAPSRHALSFLLLLFFGLTRFVNVQCGALLDHACSSAFIVCVCVCVFRGGGSQCVNPVPPKVVVLQSLAPAAPIPTCCTRISILKRCPRALRTRPPVICAHHTPQSSSNPPAGSRV